MKTARSFLILTTAAVGLLTATDAHSRAADKPAPTAITVYKDPDCGCCKKWVDHLREHGFRVTSHDTRDMDEVKANLGVPDKLHSCHTAVVNGYTIEGHVPAADIRKLLKSREKVRGLAVPGMPVGSPGMEGSRQDKYETIAFSRNGKSRIFAKH